MGDQSPSRHFQEMVRFERITQHKGEGKVEGWREGEEARGHQARKPLIT
jgi:hypothetical protein